MIRRNSFNSKFNKWNKVFKKILALYRKKTLNNSYSNSSKNKRIFLKNNSKINYNSFSSMTYKQILRGLIKDWDKLKILNKKNNNIFKINNYNCSSNNYSKKRKKIKIPS